MLLVLDDHLGAVHTAGPRGPGRGEVNVLAVFPLQHYRLPGHSPPLHPLFLQMLPSVFGSFFTFHFPPPPLCVSPDQIMSFVVDLEFLHNVLSCLHLIDLSKCL